MEIVEDRSGSEGFVALVHRNGLESYLMLNVSFQLPISRKKVIVVTLS